MNDKSSEQIFDYLIEEALVGPEPPDLTDRIVAAWSEEQASQPRESEKPKVVAELVDQIPLPDLKESPQLADDAPTPPPIQGLAQKNSSQVSSNGSRRFVSALATLVATVILGVLGVNLLLKGLAEPDAELAEGADGASANGTEVVSTEPGGAKLKQGDNREVPVESLVNDQSAPLDLDDLPFSSNPVADIGSREQPQSGTDTIVADRLASQEVVTELDSRLRSLWSELGVKPSPRLSNGLLVAKIGANLIGDGKAATETIGKSRSGSVLEYARLVSSNKQFANHWAKVLTGRLLKQSFVSTSGPEANALRRGLQRRLLSTSDWGDIVADLVGGEVSGDLKKSNSLATPFYAALGGKDNHRLVTRIGTNFLDQNLACSRCHQLGAPSDVAKRQTQDAYWGMVAMFHGISAARVNPDSPRLAVDRQRALASGEFQEIFELPNGEMKAVMGSLPDGVAWQAEEGTTPRKAFADWVVASNALDRAAVNTVWDELFGRQLVPHVADVDVVGLPERVALLEFLSAQFRSHDRDLRKLATWLVSSEAFSLAPVALSEVAWLEASDSDLESMQLAELAFASAKSLGTSSESRGLQSSVAFLMKSGNGELDAMPSTLAQPSAVSANGKSGKPPRALPKLKMPPMSIVLHQGRPTAAEQRYISKIVGSANLDWETRAAHVVLLSDHESMTGRNIELASNLLKHHEGDQEAALQSLLWAVKNSSAN